MMIEHPPEIKSLLAQCECGIISFDNDQMSEALYYAQMKHVKLAELLETCEWLLEEITVTVPGRAADPMLKRLQDAIDKAIQANG